MQIAKETHVSVCWNIRVITFSVSMMEHLKCPFGQLAYPCKPHGRQSSISDVSKTKETSDKGPKPKAGTVEQYIAATGALTAEAKCKGAESFTKFIRAFFINAADSKKDNWPARFSIDD